MNNWVTLSDDEKSALKNIMGNVPRTRPTVFNLESDKCDIGGEFAEMTEKQVSSEARDSAKRFRCVFRNASMLGKPN